MKLTKKQENEIWQVYNTWLDAYLNGDVQTYDNYLEKDYHFIGSTNNEEFLSKKDTTNFFRETADQLAGKCDLRNENRIIEKFGELVFITHLFDAWFKNGDDYTYYGRFRFTNTLKENKGGWRFIYQHFSTPDGKTDEGETIGFEKINEENQELREAIKRRTIELEEKNRELEIEGALDRIRAQAVAMKQSSDLLDIVVSMRNEFTKLGHEAHYFWHMMWLPEKYEKAMTSGDGNKIGFVMELPRHMHGDIPLLAKWEKSKKPTVVYAMDVEAAINYVDKMVRLGNFKNIDPQAPTHEDIQKIGGLTFVMARTTHGEIGYSLPSVVKNPPAGDIDILIQFASAFDLAHRRFLDLQKAEKQAREVQIELALEKVRSRTMAMQHSDELAEASFLLDQQVRGLGIKTWGCAFNIYEEKESTEWFGNEAGVLHTYTVPRAGIFKEYYDRGQKGETLFIQEFSGDECVAHYEYMSSLPILGDVLKQLKETNEGFPTFQIDHVVYFKYGYLLFISREPVPDAYDIFKRFAKVFEQTYTRFLDLQKAEAQAKEAQIETALERVRSRSMAMHTSKEIGDVAFVLFQQLKSLGGELWGTGFGFCEQNADVDDFWFANENGIMPHLKIPNTVDPAHKQMYQGWKKNLESFSIVKDGKELEDHYKYMLTVPDVQPIFQGMLNEGITFPKWQKWHAAYFKYGYMLVITTEPYKNEVVLNRFAKVFEQAYTRFLDLQKAEAQAREAQIETALEKIRSRTMAMQHSEELPEAANDLFIEVQKLGIPAWSCGYNILSEDKKSSVCFMSSEGEIQSPFVLPLTKHKSLKPWHRAILNNESFFVYEQGGKDLEEHYDFMQSIPDLKETFQQLRDADISLPTFQVNHLAKFTNGFLLFITYERVPDAHDIFQRFGKVFNQTYTRFLDLKKAEEQAREAQIEAALEKVRSRSLAMQNADELKDVVMVIVEKLTELGVIMDANGITLCTYFPNSKDVLHWIASPDFSHVGKYLLPYFEHVILKEAWQSKEQGDAYFSKAYSIKDKNSFFEHAFEHSDYKHLPEEFKQWIFKNDQHILSFAWQKNSALLIPSNTGVLPTENEKDILIRFSKVFEQAYIRFMDLKKAEAQTRQAKIEGALERVRARALAMQNPEELKEVADVLRTEMGLLGFEELETCSIYINDTTTEKTECWYAIKDIRSKKKKLVNDYFELNLKDTWVGKKMLQFYNTNDEHTSIVMTGKNRKAWINYCEKHSKPLKGYYGEQIPDRTYHLYKFSHGSIGVATAGNISEENWNLLKRAASTFSLAYSRFKDLTQARIDLLKLKEEKKKAEDALSELQLTQTQLIQAEKMASLGELTAGIAHEIQNPLNFVNNFSEVSNELIDEMNEEIEKGDLKEAQFIAGDIKQNLEKITHHGKRADAIVKGMLQHSRSNSGQRELTDINALTDEYLRLAYHGLRAKDKTFNATMNTDFDALIGKINIVPQDMGRVILNLITNAFYAVNEKKQHTPNNYQPTVSVCTKKNGNNVVVQVTDNGNGIPKEVMDKIFQPFFTTKPTGQGTGLGLSMSYDIIKAHGGKIEVTSKENEGTGFSIHLPINH